MKKIKISFFRKLLLLMLVVNIPLVFSIAVFSYHSIYTIKEDTVKTVRTNQQNLVNIVENDVGYVEQQLYHIANMDDWNVLRETSRKEITYSGIYAINQFRDRFQNVLSTSRLFENICVGIEGSDFQFSVNDGIEDFDQEKYAALYSSTEGYVRFKSREGNLYITSQEGWSRDRAVSIDAQIDLAKLQNLLGGEKTFLNEQMLIFFNTNPDPVIVCDGISEEILGAIREGGKAAVENGEIFPEDVILIHTASALEDFEVYSIVKESDIYTAMAEFYSRLFWILAGSVLVVLAYGIIVSRMLQKPVQILSEGFRKVEMGDFAVRLNRKGEDEFAVLYQRFNTMVEKLEQLINENYVKELYAQRAVYRQLQSQINPHFLYNSFFVLQNMIQDEDNENAAAFTRSLSRYFKFITRTEQEEVPLSEEVEHAGAYLDIMKRRYGRRLEYSISCRDDACLDLMTPRLILQPFIENVFIHGFQGKRETVKITLEVFQGGRNRQEQTGDFTWIKIEDNGSGMEKQRLEKLMEELSQSSENNTSAIFNINRRLRIKFGAEYGVTVENSENGGLRIWLRLPKNGTD